MNEKHKPTLAEVFERYRAATAHYHPVTEPDPNYRPYNFEKHERVVESATSNKSEDTVKKLSQVQDVVSDLIFDLGNNWNKRTRNSVFHSVRINTDKHVFNIVSNLALQIPSTQEDPITTRPIIAFEFAKGERNGEMFGVDTDTFLSITLQGGARNERLYYLFDCNGAFVKLSNSTGSVKGIRKEIVEYGDDNVVCQPAEKIDHTRVAVVLSAINNEFSSMLSR